MSEKTLVEQLRDAEMKGQFGLGFGQIASCIETRYTPNSEIEAKYMPYPLDADGVPCKVGDLVETDEHIPRKVVGYYLDCPEYPCVTLEFVSPSVESYKLHHVKPDTQKRIDDDATMPAATYCVSNCLVDSDTDVDEATLLQMHITDLLRRQRELDAKTTGGE